MKRRFLALGGVVALAVGGCSGAAHDKSAPTTLPPASTAAAPNPDVIPPVITVAYVNAVFRALNHIYGDATRALVTAHSVTPAVKADLRAIFNDPVYEVQLSYAQDSLKGVINNVRPDGGDGVTVVAKLVAATSDCIFAETTTNLSQLLIHPTPAPASEYYRLTPKQPRDDPDHLNATPWAYSYDVAYLTPTTVASQCAS